MDSQRPNYHYVALDSQQREIRVIQLDPGNFGELLRASLLVRSLDTTPIYNALSYVWGDASTAGQLENVLFIDGHEFPVTANLRTALQYIRPLPGASPLTIWVDAVCINQMDLDERTCQVSMMRDIYASAERVFIWLGEASDVDQSNAVFDALPYIIARDNVITQGDIVEQDRDLFNTVRLCSGFFAGLADRRPWFSRVWIIQELALAKNDPLVVCGNKSTSWSTFMAASRILTKLLYAELGMVRPLVKVAAQGDSDPNTKQEGSIASSSGENVEPLAQLKADVLDSLYRAIKSQGGESLRRLLMISRTSQATDPRDRIYALLGLLKPSLLDPDSDGFVAIDYRKSTSAVYADAVAHIFAQGEGPYFLSHIFLPGVSTPAPQIAGIASTVSQARLPSWVPDFSGQVAGKATQPLGTLFHPHAGAGASGVGAECNNGKVLADGQTLRVEGLFVDVIKQVVPLGSSVDACIQQLPGIEALAAEARQWPCRLEASIASYVKRFKSQEPLWRALISNKRLFSGYDPAPSSYEAMYKNLLEQAAKGIKSEQVESEYEKCLKAHVSKQSFFVTNTGFIGTCVPDSREGDNIAILFGSPVPFVLRPGEQSVEVNETDIMVHSLIGASYVSGIMGGEMVDELYCEDLMDSTSFYIQ